MSGVLTPKWNQFIGQYYNRTHFPYKSIITANPISLQHDLYETVRNMAALYFFPDIDPENLACLPEEVMDENAVLLCGQGQYKTAYFVMNSQLFKYPDADEVATVKVRCSEHEINGKAEDNAETSAIIKKATSRLYAKSVYVPAKEAYTQSAEHAGLSRSNAKKYAKYRAKDGLTHEEARYKADPVF